MIYKTNRVMLANVNSHDEDEVMAEALALYEQHLDEEEN